MKTFVEPELDITRFYIEDIIATSEIDPLDLENANGWG